MARDPLHVNFRIDFWVCRDSNGVLHAAQIGRYFNKDGVLVRMQGSTACLPVVRSHEIPPGDRHGRKIPPFLLDTRRGGNYTTLIEYGVREAPTCVTCAVLARPG